MKELPRTEKRNPYTKNIDTMSTIDMGKAISREDFNAAKAVEDASESIAQAIDAISNSLANGNRLFYIGAGTSGRLGILDASECPPTYGVGYDVVTGIIAGGRDCMFKASENAEDIAENGRRDIIENGVKKGDVVVGISVSGNAAYVVEALKQTKELGGIPISLTCNKNAKINEVSDINIITDTGEEVITGSTRMKAGTAHKMVLNMLSTCAMIKTGKVYENLMINLRPTNIKLKARMVRIVSDILDVDLCVAEKLLEDNDWVIRTAVENYKNSK